jgi:hypothetical protein
MLVRLRLRRGKAGSSCAVGYPGTRPLVYPGAVALGTKIDSGRDCCGNEGGRGEERVRIFDNSRVYHSESDSSSEEYSSEDSEEGAVRS